MVGGDSVPRLGWPAQLILRLSSAESVPPEKPTLFFSLGLPPLLPGRLASALDTTPLVSLLSSCI